MVNNVWCKALILQKAVGFISTIATIIGYITIKDHQESFPEKPSFRIINPSKFDIGKVSNRMLDHIKQNISQNINTSSGKIPR